MIVMFHTVYCISDDPCIYHKKGVFWDIGKLKTEVGTQIDGPDGATIEFNICEQVSWNGEEGYAKLEYSDGSCYLLTDDSNNPTVKLVNDEDLRLNFRYTGDEVCAQDNTQKYEFQLQVECSSDDKSPVFEADSSSPCKIPVKWESKSGCPILKLNAIWNYLSKYRMYLIPVLIIIGLFFLVLGSCFTKISVFLISAITIVFIILLILYSFILSFSTPEWVGWIILPVSVIIGVIAGFFLASFLKLGTFVIGAWFGATLAMILFEMFVYKISSKEFVLWIMIALLGLIIGILALKFLKTILIIGTSFIGAFMVVRGVSFYIGGYPNEFELYNEIQVGNIDNVPYTFYIYAAFIVILAVIGAIVQYKKFGLCKKNGSRGGYDKMSP